MLIKLKRGLDLPLTGAPEQIIHAAPRVTTVGLVGADYVDLRHSMAVSEGERVRLGQTLYTDRRYSEVCYTAPGSGYVRAIHRGAKRRLASVVIELDGEEAESFPAHDSAELGRLSVATVQETLLRSGLFTAFRVRPYGRVPAPDQFPSAIFVTAIDTNPLAVDPGVVIGEYREAFDQGLTVLSRLPAEKVYVCTSPSANLSIPQAEGLASVQFQGPHPAGLPGTHIHHLAPGGTKVWYIGYQDVIALGKLFVTGDLWRERIVALGGSGFRNPRLVRAPVGASLDDLVCNEVAPDCRIISGSVLSGRRTAPTAAHLGRYHTQVTVIPEVARRNGLPRLFSRLMGRDRGSRQIDTAANGLPSGMLPVEAFERVWPLHVPPAPLLRALLVRDTEAALELGCLDLDEEDLSLCSYVCPAKYDYGSALRATLRDIERAS